MGKSVLLDRERRILDDIKQMFHEKHERNYDRRSDYDEQG